MMEYEITFKHEDTKRMCAYYYDYLRSNKSSIYEAYNYPSYRKVDIFNTYKRLLLEAGFTDVKIVSANTNIFTIGATKTINGRNAFFIITKTKKSYIYLNEID